jgi:hypothetical protein
MSQDLHEACAQQLVGRLHQAGQLSAFIGLDGFVDEIIHVVDKRESADSFARIPTIRAFSERLAEAAGKSTNIELVNTLTKLGGNGPILAHAMACFGVRVTYLGNLGYPSLHPVFQKFAETAEVHSIADACHTDALEFEDGKLLLGKSTQLKDVTWENIQMRYGRDRFAAKFNTCNLVSFVNWTMVPFMSEIWESVLQELCPILTGPRRMLFFDLADPQKRSARDIARALDLMARFQEYFEVTLGANEKEAGEIARSLGVKSPTDVQEGLAEMAAEMRRKLGINTVAIHPVTYAVAAGSGQIDLVEGPYVPKPLITTGAGDHFNGGFCLGKLLGLNNEMSLLTGVAASGFYVRSARTPDILDLVDLLRNWPENKK